MSDPALQSLVQIVELLQTRGERMRCRLLALEDMVRELGVPAEVLEERFREHWLQRQVQVEELIGPSEAARKFSGDDEREPAG